MYRLRLAMTTLLASVIIGTTFGMLLNLSPARADTICVNGTSINTAVAQAQPGDTIRVAAGAYTEYVTITKTVTLLGGWNAGCTVRDPAANVTTIRPPDASFSVVHIQGQFANPAAVAPTLDGFTITGGGGGNHGGGLRLTDSNAVVSNNVITGNIAFLLGGGIWVQRGAPLIQNNRIENNRVTPSGSAYGGGIELENTQATLVNNVVANNSISATVGYGGGVAIEDGEVTLNNNTIISNTATNQAGGPTDSSYGGGVSARNASVGLSNNVIQGNTASSVGRGFGGGVYILSSPAFTLTANSVLSNTAGFAPGTGPYLLGGGILVDSSQGRLFGNIVAGNRANRNTIFGSGGGLAALTSTLTMQGGQVTNNSVSQNCEGYGGGLYMNNSTLTLDTTRVEKNCAANTPFYGLGGGLAFVNSPYTMTNALIIQNYSFGNDTAVGGLFAGANSPGSLVNNTLANNNGQGIRVASPLTLTNNIIMGHTTGVSLTAAVPVSVTFNDFYANTTNQRGFSLDVTNIVINPQLDANYHLTGASPLLDAGARANAPDHDLDGEPRPMVGPSDLFRVDIGADERTGAAQRNINLNTGAADLTIIGLGGQDPVVNGVNDWIGSSVLGDDINGDGRADLAVAAHDWAEDPDNPPFTTGRLFGLFNFGARLTGTIDLLTTTPNLTVVSQLKLQHIGAELAGGDLNGDGKGDLLIGSSQDDGAGNGAVTPTVFALWGGPSLAGTRVLSTISPADFMLRAPGQDFFAFSAKNALTTGDLDGNGVTDLVVGDALANDGGLAESGAVFVMFGRNTLSGLLDLSLTPADYTLYGPATNAGLGLAALGRVNAGAQVDLVARTETTAYVIFGPVSSGSQHLGTTAPNVTITGLQIGGVIVTDLTGDGQDDVILGSGSKLYVISGPLTNGDNFNAASQATLTMNNIPAGSLAVGNVVGDARPDLIVSAPSLKQVYVIAGGLTVSGNAPIADVATMVVNVPLGTALFSDVGTGDLDHDNKPDLLISTSADVDTHPSKYKDAGKVFVMYGGSEGGSGSPLSPSFYLPIIMKNH